MTSIKPDSEEERLTNVRKSKLFTQVLLKLLLDVWTYLINIVGVGFRDENDDEAVVHLILEKENIQNQSLPSVVYHRELNNSIGGRINWKIGNCGQTLPTEI